MQNGPENFMFTDEGDIDNFLGIDIKYLVDNKFEITQPFLIERIANLLGLKTLTLNLIHVQLLLENQYCTNTYKVDRANYFGNTEHQLVC